MVGTAAVGVPACVYAGFSDPRTCLCVELESYWSYLFNFITWFVLDIYTSTDHKHVAILNRSQREILVVLLHWKIGKLLLCHWRRIRRLIEADNGHRFPRSEHQQGIIYKYGVTADKITLLVLVFLEDALTLHVYVEHDVFELRASTVCELLWLLAQNLLLECLQILDQTLTWLKLFRLLFPALNHAFILTQLSLKYFQMSL